jgi:integrase/DNA-binding transcriptional regulator YhcF (GntR family)
MSTSKADGRRRQRGEIEQLPSGALRIRVYAGRDPLTNGKHYLVETISAEHANPRKEAERVRTRMLNEVDEKRNARTKATVDVLMTRYLDIIDVDETTKNKYNQHIRVHIRPLLGKLPIGKLDGETLDTFFLILRTCRKHCKGKKFIEHRTPTSHECDDRCRPHECKPLGNSTIRQVRSCLSGALSRALRWKWISVNPLEHCEPAKISQPDPNPPTAEQAAIIVNEAFQDLMWGVFIWLAMVTGARRGEICALRIDGFNRENRTLEIRASIAQRGKKTWEKDTKGHQKRIIALDETAFLLLELYLALCKEEATKLGITLSEDARIFSLSPDNNTWLKPDSVSQRYTRMCQRLGWDMNIHELRHYSATELVAAGVDPRTIAGRMGHSGGGTTTLKVYSAWVSEADQRAAGNLAAHMPAPPIALDDSGLLVSRAQPRAEHPYQKIVNDLMSAITCGALKVGDPIPTQNELARRYNVSAGTTARVFEMLKEMGIIQATRGKRALVIATRLESFDSRSGQSSVVNLAIQRQKRKNG